ncbi:MAG: ABC transporter substrate-binding protein [Clostridiaceae bacterium]|nr:ABC transporter substrate-binding protein [Clostridiaceae bacterium]
MTRKILTMTLALIMVFAVVLTGCNSGNGTATTTASTTTAAGTTAATTAGATTTAAATTAPAASGSSYDTGSIEFEPLGIDGEGASLVWYSAMPPHDTRQQVWDETMKYVKDVYNMDVQANLTEWAEYGAKVKTLIASGMAPDVFFTVPSFGFLDYVADEVLLDLTDYFPQYMPKTLAKTPEGILDAVTFDGKIYAVVPFKDLAENNSVLYDQRWLDESGLTMPEWTRMYDLDELLYGLREWVDTAHPERKDIPISDMYSLFYRNFDLETYSSQNTTIATNYKGLEFIEGYEAEKEMFCMYDTPEFLAHVKRLNQMVTDRIYPYDIANYDKDRVNRKSGDQFVWYSQGYVFAPDNLTDYACKLQMQSVSMMFTGYVQAAMNAVYSDTENPEAACKYIEIMNNDPFLGTQLRFGYEGTHWTLTDNGQADCSMGKESGVKYWYGVQIGDITNCILPTDVSPEFGKALQDLNNNSIRSSNLGFSPDTANVLNEVTAVAAVCTEYLNNTSLYSGMLTDADTDKIVDEFVTKLKDSGVETILNEFQTQLDAWRSANGK